MVVSDNYSSGYASKYITDEPAKSQDMKWVNSRFLVNYSERKVDASANLLSRAKSLRAQLIKG